jgi:replicative DNA helicase
VGGAGITYATRSQVYPEFSSPDSVERGFLCCVLLDPTDRAAIDQIVPDAFRSGRNRTIFQAIKTIVGDGGTPTADAVRAKLEATGTLDRAGGLGYLIELTQETSGPSLRTVYLNHLKREAARYALEQLGALLSVEAARPDAGLEALCSLAQAMLTDVRDLKPDAALVKRRVWTTQRRAR